MTRILDVSKWKWRKDQWKSPQGTKVDFDKLAIWIVWDEKLKRNRLCNLWHEDYSNSPPDGRSIDPYGFPAGDPMNDEVFIEVSRWRSKYKVARVTYEDMGEDYTQDGDGDGLIGYTRVRILRFPDVPKADFEKSPFFYLLAALTAMTQNGVESSRIIHATMLHMGLIPPERSFEEWLSS